MQVIPEGSAAAAGAIKKLSDRYRGFGIRTAAEAGSGYTKWPDVEVFNGKIIKR